MSIVEFLTIYLALYIVIWRLGGDGALLRDIHDALHRKENP